MPTCRGFMRQSCRRLIFTLGFAVILSVLSAPKAFASGCNLDTVTTGSNYLCTAFGSGALFQVVQPHPTGTGVIDSFLRVQMNGTEQGFNTDYRSSGPVTAGTCG